MLRWPISAPPSPALIPVVPLLSALLPFLCTIRSYERWDTTEDVNVVLKHIYDVKA